VEARIGLPQDELLKDIRLLERGGRMYSGPDVYRYLMRRTWWAYPLYLLSRVPVLRQAFNSAYRAFARNRMRISASCGLHGQGLAHPSDAQE
jgi:predicted DCC family thiol-disulfide oxidoreductase YuxK